MSAVMSLHPGSAAWLVQHEVRLAWRAVNAGKRWDGRVWLALLCFFSLFTHLGAYVVLRMLPAGALPDWANFIIGGVLLLLFSLMVSQAVLQSVAALFDRGDLDLLLSSPLPTRHVFMARGLGIAASVVGLYLFLLAPLANMGLFTGHANLLGIYPTLAALALGATALGMGLTLSLVRLLGARRARTVAQVLGALIGALMFLVSQAQNLMGPDLRQRWFKQLMQWAQADGPLAPDSPLWFPARALQGEALPLLALLALGAGAFWLMVRFTHRRFLAGTQESVTGSARRGLAAPRSGSTRFHAGLWRNVLFKEWRLILRDPQLITQTLLQVLYLTPMLLIALRNGGHQSPALLVPAVIWLALSLASNLAWITVAAEDAPELLGSSPVALRRLRWLKVLAALLPVWLLMAPLCLYQLGQGLWPGLVFLLCLAGGTLSVGMAQVWYPRQGKRADMKRRMQGNGLACWLEPFIALGWAALAYCLVAAPRFVPLPLLLVLCGSGGIWLLGRSRREEGIG